MTVTEVEVGLDSSLLARLREVTGEATNAEAVNAAIGRMERYGMASSVLIDDGEFLTISGPTTRVTTTEMVNDALADEY